MFTSFQDPTAVRALVQVDILVAAPADILVAMPVDTLVVTLVIQVASPLPPINTGLLPAPLVSVARPPTSVALPPANT